MIGLPLAWLHDLSPWVFEINGFGVRWYGLSYVAGFIVAWIILKWLGKKQLVSVPPERAADAIMALAIGAVVGGRLGYAVFYQPSLLWGFEASPPFWDMLRLSRGGMASHGGMIGALVASWLIARGFKNDVGQRVGKAPVLHVLDIVPLVGAPGVLLGRLANFVNGELLGKIVAAPGEPAPWWAVRFPQERLTGHAPELTPEQALELDRLLLDVDPDAATVGEAYTRVLDLVQGGSQQIAERLEPLISARHPSQIYQAFGEAVVFGVICWWIARRPVRTGVLSGAFLISYGIMRIATEFFRLPDDHFAVARPLGLSRGQWLSAAMVAVGIGVLICARMRTEEKRYFGWASRSAD